MLYLIDGSSQMYRAYHAPVRTADGGLLRNAQGTPTNAVYIFVTMLRKLLNEHKPEFIAASFDLPGRTFRDDLVADYKANRAPMPDELAEQIPMVHAACEALGVPILTSERYEADDVIGTLASKAAAAGFDVAIVTDATRTSFSSSRDGIRVYNPRDEGTWYDAAGVKEKFGVAPEQVVDVLALMGDTIDNIKGVPGIGEKGARELIAQLRIAREPARARRPRSSTSAIARGCSPTRTTRARAASWRGSAPTCRSSSTPKRCATAAARASAASRSSTSSASARSPRNTRRPPTRSPRPTASSTPPTALQALAARLRAAGRVRAAGAARSAGGDARGDRRPRVFDRAARRRLRADRPPRRSATTASAAARRRRSTRCGRSSRTRRSTRSATT